MDNCVKICYIFINNCSFVVVNVLIKLLCHNYMSLKTTF